MSFATRTRASDGVTVVDIAGRLTDNEGSALRDMLLDLLKKGHTQFLLNLRKVEYLDSSGIGQLVSCYSTLKRRGGEMKMLYLTPRLKEVFRVTNLSTVFEDFLDEKTAVRSFARK